MEKIMKITTKEAEKKTPYNRANLPRGSKLEPKYFTLTPGEDGFDEVNYFVD